MINVHESNSMPEGIVPESGDSREAQLAEALYNLMDAFCSEHYTIRVGSNLDKAWRKALRLLRTKS